MHLTYTFVLKQKADTAGLIIMKGANGDIKPFSKKYDNPEIATRTQFSLAEAYLEMAKRHRKLGEHELAQHEYARAKDMLERLGYRVTSHTSFNSTAVGIHQFGQIRYQAFPYQEAS